MVKLDLAAHADFIGEMSSNANKELAIETALNELQARWADVQVPLPSLFYLFFLLPTFFN